MFLRTAAAFVLVTFITPNAQGIVIGGFDEARGGNRNLGGVRWLAIRSEIDSAFEDVEFRESEALSSVFLSSVDVLVISAVYESPSGTPVAPLTSLEQTALREFILRGGGALLIAEGPYVYRATSNSILEPFDVANDYSYTYPDAHPPLTQVADHAILNGPFGEVHSFWTHSPGALVDLAPYASSLLAFENGRTCVATIDRGALGPGSGAVVLVADDSIATDYGIYYADNLNLALNSIAFLSAPVPEPATIRLWAALGIAALLAARRRKRGG